MTKVQYLSWLYASLVCAHCGAEQSKDERVDMWRVICIIQTTTVTLAAPPISRLMIQTCWPR